MLQNKNIWMPQGYSLCASMQVHVFKVLFALEPTFQDFHACCWSRAFHRYQAPQIAPITIAVHHLHSLDINIKMLQSITMTQHTILDIQVTRTDKNISARLRIEVSALSSHSCFNINDGEAKASALKPNYCHHHTVACAQVLPAHHEQLRQWCPEVQVAFPYK